MAANAKVAQRTTVTMMCESQVIYGDTDSVLVMRTREEVPRRFTEDQLKILGGLYKKERHLILQNMSSATEQALMDIKDERPVSSPPGGPAMSEPAKPKEILFGGDHPYLSKLGFSRGKDLYRFYKWNRQGDYKDSRGSKWFPWIRWADENVLGYLDRGTREADIDNLELPTEELLARISKEKEDDSKSRFWKSGVSFGGASWHSDVMFFSGGDLFNYIEELLSDSMVISAKECQWWDWYVEKREYVDKFKFCEDRAAAVKRLPLPVYSWPSTRQSPELAETKDVTSILANVVSNGDVEHITVSRDPNAKVRVVTENIVSKGGCRTVGNPTTNVQATTDNIVVKNGDVETIAISTNPVGHVRVTTENIVSNGGCRTVAIVGNPTAETFAALAALSKRH